MSLTQDDITPVLQVVGRFASGSIAPMIERPEIPLQPQQLEQLASKAEEIGLLNLSDEPGLGLWESVTEASGLALSVAALLRLAEENAGLAWHFHQLALGGWLARRLGLNELLRQGPLMGTIQGSYGLARTALARYLREAALTDDDLALLDDYFAPWQSGGRLILHAAEGWRWLLFPLFDQDRLKWCALAHDAIEYEALGPTHGLDEIACLGWRPRTEVQLTAEPQARTSREVYGEALQIMTLGLIAIALGAVRRGYRLARDYAAIRRQGGALIDRHPAVQQMLSGISSAIQAGTSLLNGLAECPLALERTGEILAARSLLQPLLSQAATDAVQIMGGIGYMRDTGVEKVLRDVNQLRLMSGTPAELQLFVAEWERLQ